MGSGTLSSNPEDTVLELRGVDAGPPRVAAPILRGVTFRLARGSCAVLLGSNGAGKSTLLRTIAGLWPPLSGDLRTPGDGVFDPSCVGLVLEDPTPQFVAGSVEEEIGFALEGQDLPDTERRERLDREVAAFALDAFRNRDPRRLSPGEQSRCLLAACAALQPPLLLLDDPFLFVSRGEALPLWRELRGRVRNGTLGAVLLCGHDAEMAAESDQVGLLAEGSLQSWGPPQRVLSGSLPDGVSPPWGVVLERTLRERNVKLSPGGWSGSELVDRLKSRGLL